MEFRWRQWIGYLTLGFYSGSIWYSRPMHWRNGCIQLQQPGGISGHATLQICIWLFKINAYLKKKNEMESYYIYLYSSSFILGYNDFIQSNNTALRSESAMWHDERVLYSASTGELSPPSSSLWFGNGNLGRCYFWMKSVMRTLLNSRDGKIAFFLSSSMHHILSLRT